ncbi:MAG TPA: hypothetical protein DEB39_11285 [Planctomycetaceae bacterium]|nr:hypothetical protein [Planctomycetaceae bacterium]
MHCRFTLCAHLVLGACFFWLLQTSTQAAWPDPDALVRDAFDAGEEPDKTAELGKYLHRYTVEMLIKNDRLDEALGYAREHDVMENRREEIVRLFVNALRDKGRFEEAVELARSVPADQLGNGPSQLLQAIAFRQAQCGRFDDALETASFLAGNWRWSAEHNIKKEERRCTLLKDGKPLRKVDGTLNNGATDDGTTGDGTTFSIFRFGRSWATDPKEPLVANLLYDSDYTPELVDAIRLTKEKKDDEAKTLFDKIVGDDPFQGAYKSGARTEGERICGIAVVQFELGRSDWAAETLARITPPKDDGGDGDGDLFPVFQDQIRLGRAIADVQVLLGDPDGAEKTLRRYFKLKDDPPGVCTVVWGEFARHLAMVGKQEKAVEILSMILDHVKSIEHHFALSDTIHIVLLAAHELKADEPAKTVFDETKKTIFDRAARYVAMRNNRMYADAYLAVVKAYARERMFTEALRFAGHDSLSYKQGEAFGLLIDAAYEAGAIDVLKQIRSNAGNDLTSRVLVARYVARLAFEAGDMEEAQREIELAVALTKNVHFHRFLEQHASMLDIAGDIRFFRETNE